MYKAYTSSFFGRNEVPELKLNWDDVEIYPSEASFKDISVKTEEPSLIFKTVFHNNSKAHQKHNLKTELKRSSFLESSVTEGYTRGSKVDLSLQIPRMMMNCAYVKSKGFLLETVEGNRQVNDVSWVIEDFIAVPELTSITVRMKIKEKENKYEFTTKKGFKGQVKATFYNKKQEKIRTFSISTRTVIHEYIPPEMVEEGDRGITYIKIKGWCKFKYDVEREIIID
ncbi:Hypothetical predicted protein [Mytilus galloprovincialis]|nr:Hypothetical predicted protein [Mytilus galloprovincialis]